MIVNHANPPKTKQHLQQAAVAKQEFESESEDDVAFIQKWAENDTCFDCGDKGHYKNSTECKNIKNKSGAQLLITSGTENNSEYDTLSCTMVTIYHNMTSASNKSDGKKKFTLVQREVMRQGTICRYWILLNSESTIGIVNDISLLINIQKVKEGKEMRRSTNGGYQYANMIGGLSGYDTVWFNPISATTRMKERTVFTVALIVIATVITATIASLHLHNKMQKRHQTSIHERHQPIQNLKS